MKDQHPRSFEEILELDVPIFEVQAWWGSTKHLGGQKATNELLALCRVGEQTKLLDVGCGVGITSCYTAKKYHCCVTGVDISSNMIYRARERAEKEKVQNIVQFETGSALNLPFPDNTFDAVIAESVLTFIGDKKRALQECLRVAKPGGYIGINEASWLKEPSSREVINHLSIAFGDEAEILSPEEWCNIFEEVHLREITVERFLFGGATRAYMASISQIGGNYIPRIFGRFFLAYVRYPAFRRYLRKILLSIPEDLFVYLGYGIYVGRKSTFFNF